MKWAEWLLELSCLSPPHPRIEWAVIVGRNIRRLRRERGLTQEQLAHEAEVAMQYLAGVERGEENVSLKYLVKIVEALKIDPATLLARRL